MQFPDERSLEASKDGTDLIRPGCSVGFNRLIGNFKLFAGMDHAPRWSMFLINATTVFRNNFDPGKSLQELTKDFLSDCEMFVTYLEAYMTITSKPAQRYPVVVYFPDYAAIPKEISREESASDKALNEAYRRFYISWKLTGPTMTSRGEWTDRWMIPVGSRSYMPQRELVSWIHRSLTSHQLGTFRLRQRIAMVSHCAVDLHMVQKIRELDLIESYTGIVKPPELFGTKLLNDKDVTIPFNVLTHRLFGDPVHIRPIVFGRNKTKVKEKIKTTNWMRVSDPRILADVNSVMPIPKSELITFNF